LLAEGTRKQSAFNRGQTNRISLTHNLHLQSPVSYGHELGLLLHKWHVIAQLSYN